MRKGGTSFSRARVYGGGRRRPLTQVPPSFRLVEGLTANDVESFRDKYSSQSSYDEASAKEAEVKADTYAGALTAEELGEVMKHRRSALKSIVFVDGHVDGEVEAWIDKVSDAQEKR